MGSRVSVFGLGFSDASAYSFTCKNSRIPEVEKEVKFFDGLIK